MRSTELKGKMLYTKEMLFIFDYLKIECCINTLKILFSFSDSKLELRMKIKSLLMCGEIKKACIVLEKEIPHFFQEYAYILPLIRSQVFIEHARNKDPEKALTYGRLCIQKNKEMECMNDLFLLLAYKDTEGCEVSKYLLSRERRDMVFSEVDTLLKGKLYKLIYLISRKAVWKKRLTSRQVYGYPGKDRKNKKEITEIKVTVSLYLFTVLLLI